MNFTIKSKVQNFLSMFPNAHKINFLFQKYVTKSLPINEDTLNRKINVAKKHFENYQRYSLTDPEKSLYYEFGAGWDLLTPVLFSSFGFKEMHVIDIRDLVIEELVKNVVSRSIEGFSVQGSLDDILKQLRIFYTAPMDARKTKYNDEIMDLIVSNVTFEHIPAVDIPPILTECNRIMKRGGIFSCTIDYQDHWSIVDKNISVYNFLKYSEEEWKKYNPPIHYQNRLRHKDYIDMFQDAGFTILEVNLQQTPNDVEILSEIPIHPSFSNYSVEELSIRGAEIVLRKE